MKEHEAEILRTEQVREIVRVYWYLFGNHCTRKCILKRVMSIKIAVLLLQFWRRSLDEIALELSTRNAISSS